MSTYKIIGVTNRKLSRIPFLEQLEKSLSSNPSAVILREKDLTEDEYEIMAGQVMEICTRYQVEPILHTYAGAAKRLGCRKLHLSLENFRRAVEVGDLSFFDEIGVSVHSVTEAVEAWRLGASYLTAGHIFATDCKMGVPPRGTGFLKEVCESVPLPVFAIGGINKDNAGEAIEAGAEGVCIMSGFMKKDRKTDGA